MIGFEAENGYTHQSVSGYDSASVNHLPMNTKTMRRVLLSAVVAALLSGCLSVYKAEIQQGNSVSQEMIDKLRPGMTRSQVRFILGTPLITDPFHLDRWDYYYYIRRQGEDIAEVRRLTVIFKNDVLVAVEGDARIKSDDTAAGDAGAPSSSQPRPAAEAATTTDTNRWQKL
ncbi:MAG TPA: outer membrane protein assembly factor BamE [Sulfuricaulis sp.]|nr:outer membrane protein assembly factor BamE [Sulfuricaulis sp.]